MCDMVSNATDVAASYKDPNGEGRICVTTIHGTQL